MPRYGSSAGDSGTTQGGGSRGYSWKAPDYDDPVTPPPKSKRGKATPDPAPPTTPAPKVGGPIKPDPPFHPVPGAGTATQQVRKFGLQRRQDQPVNYKKHVLFAVVAAFVVQLAANPSRVRVGIFGK